MHFNFNKLRYGVKNGIASSEQGETNDRTPLNFLRGRGEQLNLPKIKRVGTKREFLGVKRSFNFKDKNMKKVGLQRVGVGTKDTKIINGIYERCGFKEYTKNEGCNFEILRRVQNKIYEENKENIDPLLFNKNVNIQKRVERNKKNKLRKGLGKSGNINNKNNICEFSNKKYGDNMVIEEMY